MSIEFKLPELGENIDTVDLSVTLSGPRATEVSAQLAVSGSATPGVDFATLPQEVRFFPGQTTVTFSLDILQDEVLENPETVVIQLTGMDPVDVTAGAYGTVTVTIGDSVLIFSGTFESGDFSQWSSHVP